MRPPLAGKLTENFISVYDQVSCCKTQIHIMGHDHKAFSYRLLLTCSQDEQYDDDENDNVASG